MFDPLYISYIIIGACLIFGLYAQFNVQSTFNRYSSISPEREGDIVAATQTLLSHARLNNISVKNIKGNLTDNFNPKDKSISLSESTRSNYSVAGLGVVAHEIGHAIQDQTGYLPYKFRQSLLPFTRLATFAFYPLFIIGIILMVITSSIAGPALVWISCGLYFLSTLFYLVTWSVERDASRRALALLRETGLLDEGETTTARAVLKAAELTYISALVTSLAYFLRFLVVVLNITSNKRN